MNSLFSNQPITPNPYDQPQSVQAPPVQLPSNQVQLSNSMGQKPVLGPMPTQPQNVQAPLVQLANTAQQDWAHDPKAQYAQHDQMQQFTNSLHTAFNLPDAKQLQKSIPGVNWSNIASSLAQHTEDMKNSQPDLGYIGNHGVVSATTAAVNGGSYMDIAAGMLGKQEGKDHQALTEFFKKSGQGTIDPQTTPWCAAFANSVLQAGGKQGTGSLAARSFLQYGSEVKSRDASKGDIVVFGRGSDQSKGHVGFVDHISADGKTVYVLAGNQGNAVSISARPVNQVLGFRRPPSGPEIKVAMNSRTTPAQQTLPQASTPQAGVAPNIHAFNAPIRELSPQEIGAIMKYNGSNQ